MHGHACSAHVRVTQHLCRGKLTHLISAPPCLSQPEPETNAALIFEEEIQPLDPFGLPCGLPLNQVHIAGPVTRVYGTCVRATIQVTPTVTICDACEGAASCHNGLLPCIHVSTGMQPKCMRTQVPVILLDPAWCPCKCALCCIEPGKSRYTRCSRLLLCKAFLWGDNLHVRAVKVLQWHGGAGLCLNVPSLWSHGGLILIIRNRHPAIRVRCWGSLIALGIHEIIN